MDLNELKKQLYKKNTQLADRPQAPEELEPGHTPAPEAAPIAQWQEGGAKKYLSLSTKRLIWLALGVATLAVAVIGGWFLWRALNSFNVDDVALDIFGQERVVSGEEINYIVRYKNNSRFAISNATLTFSFPAQSLLISNGEAVSRGESLVATENLGTLSPGQSGQAEFKIRVLGDKDSRQKFTVKLNYRPANINSDFSNTEEFISTIISVPLVLSFILPERIVSGQTVNFTLRYLNTSEAAFTDAKLKVEYPEGFIFDSALPSPVEGNDTWDLPEIGSREEGNIVIKGTVAGNEGENKVFKAQIGTQKNDEDFVVYSQTLASPRISVSPLAVEQSLLNIGEARAGAGQSLIYKIKYRNTTEVAIGPVFVTVKIDSQVVDLASVNVTNGYFSSSDGLITWNSSSLPALESLASQAEGTLEFYLRVKDRLPVNKFSDKNFTIVTTAKIDSFNTPLALSGTQLTGQSRLTVKIDSKLVLSMKGYYSDKLLPNSGPLPPMVGQKTTYTIYWQVQNISNDVTGAVVEAFLPSYVRWENNYYPKNEDIKYEPATGRVTWTIGALPSAIGVLSPVRQVAFQVGLVPSIGQVGDKAVIVQPAKLSGQDNFTGATLTNLTNELKSDMPDDQTVGDIKGKIMQ